MEVNIYIRFWTLKMKYTQYGLYGKAAFKNARVRLGRGAEALAFLVLPMLVTMMSAALVRGI
jgi:hypothetical protein